MKRRCLTCGELTDKSLCARHRTRQARGYGTAHEQARRSLVAALPSRCAYCGETITSADELAAAHIIDGDPTAGWQPSHPRCNNGAKHQP
jgi:DNA-directed RNA polymerase subunit N (RpoN/RPB10)